MKTHFYIEYTNKNILRNRFKEIEIEIKTEWVINLNYLASMVSHIIAGTEVPESPLLRNCSGATRQVSNLIKGAISGDYI